MGKKWSRAQHLNYRQTILDKRIAKKLPPRSTASLGDGGTTEVTTREDLHKELMKANSVAGRLNHIVNTLVDLQLAVNVLRDIISPSD